jgi:hypothetical protein
VIKKQKRSKEKNCRKKRLFVAKSGQILISNSAQDQGNYDRSEYNGFIKGSGTRTNVDEIRV